MNYLTKDIIRCYGLWLAEGDSKTDKEITFTNNDFELVMFFHTTLKKNLVFINKPRIYIYYPKNKQQKKIKGINIKEYIDKRATKPYYLYRIYGKEILKSWKCLHKKMLTPKFYDSLMQGFFAGEGNVKFSKKSKSRTVRLAQKTRKIWIEQIFDFWEIRYNFRKGGRAYSIWGRTDLEKLYKKKIFRLHSERHKKFEEMFLSYKQIHLPKGELKRKIKRMLTEPKTTKELTKIFRKSESRISQVLNKLKKEGIVVYFKARKKVFWIKKDKNIIIISPRKKEYLDMIKNPVTIKQIRKKLIKGKSSIKKRMEELKRLGLIKKEGEYWIKIKTNKRIMVL